MSNKVDLDKKEEPDKKKKEASNTVTESVINLLDDLCELIGDIFD